MILVINPGSSSLKYKIYKDAEHCLTLVDSGAVNNISDSAQNSHANAAKKMAEIILKKYPRIDQIGYRIVHGGGKLENGVLVTKSSLAILREFSNLAPLHNPPAIETTQALEPLFGRAKHHMFFDTDFFNDLPEVEQVYPLPFSIIDKYKIRRFGFHGISHKQMASAEDPKGSKSLITVHLGAGCSVAAIKNGKPIATSLGYTPDEGLIMQTRSGDIDPGLVLYLAEKLGIDQTRNIIEKKSGLAALAGTGGNMLDILYLAGEKIEDDDYKSEISRTLEKREKALLAIEKYTRQIEKYIAYYSVLLKKVDVLVFGGKIGYGSSVIRNRITEDLNCLPIGEFSRVSPDEELEIAKEILDKRK